MYVKDGEDGTTATMTRTFSFHSVRLSGTCSPQPPSSNALLWGITHLHGGAHSARVKTEAGVLSKKRTFRPTTPSRRKQDFSRIFAASGCTRLNEKKRAKQNVHGTKQLHFADFELPSTTNALNEVDPFPLNSHAHPSSRFRGKGHKRIVQQICESICSRLAQYTRENSLFCRCIERKKKQNRQNFRSQTDFRYFRVTPIRSPRGLRVSLTRSE